MVTSRQAHSRNFQEKHVLQSTFRIHQFQWICQMIVNTDWMIVILNHKMYVNYISKLMIWLSKYTFYINPNPVYTTSVTQILNYCMSPTMTQKIPANMLELSQATSRPTRTKIHFIHVIKNAFAYRECEKFRNQCNKLRNISVLSKI